MPTISDESTVKAIAKEFVANGRNKAATLEKVGYSHNFAYGGNGTRLYDRETVKAAIKAEDRRLQAKIDYNYEIAIKELNQVIDNLALQAKKGNISANAALTQVIREKNAITGLHKQIIVDETQKKELSESEQAEARRLANLRLRQGA